MELGTGNREPGTGPPHCSGVEIKIEHVLSWLKIWNDSGSDYTEEEARSAYLAMQASGWMWGKNPVYDPRAAIERQIQTDRQRKRNGKSAFPETQLRALEEQILKHQANPESASFNKNCSNEQRQEFKDLKIKRQTVSKQIALG